MFPLKRTPPQAPAQDSSSSNTDASASSSVKTRKMKIAEDALTIEDKFKGKFMELIKELKSSHQKNFDSLKTSIDEIKSQNIKLQETVEFMAEKYDEMNIKMAQFQDERKEDKNYIKQLEERIEQMERQSRSCSLEIRNIPKKDSETKADLINIMINTSNILEVPLKPTDIRDVFRLNKPLKSNSKFKHETIITEFVNTPIKETILASIKSFNTKEDGEKLNSTHLGYDGPSVPIFISESLTPKARRLLFLSRGFAATNDYKYCWTSRGKVFMRKQNGSKKIYIQNEGDIAGLKEQ